MTRERSGDGTKEWLLSLSSVTLSRDGTRLLSGIDLDIVPGERLLVLGPNGAGKTLLMQVAHRLIAPTHGQVKVRAHLREAMVFQRPVLLRRSVIGNVLYAIDHARPGAAAPGSVGEVSDRDLPGSTTNREERAVNALRLVGLEALAHRPARVLSGGEQQRVALARAAALRPDLVWLDEPTANLDPAATQAIESIVMRMSAEGATCIMSTHDIGQARRLAQRVVLMAGGRIIESTEAGCFFAQPSTDAGRRYLSGELLNV
jgi:tungstate transport system ATP-binding protein